MPTTSQVERAEVYKDHRSQLILSKFLSGEITRLDPVYDPKYGYRYPIVDAIIGNPADTEKFLNKLYEINVLKRELYDKIIYCPDCQSANVSIRYCCPYCKSFNIHRSSLIEHVQCGYIDVEEGFKKGGRLVCPRCRKELTKPDVNYRKAGIWCKCSDCGKSFDIPVPSHFCRDCKQDFTFEDSLHRSVYSFRLNEEVTEEAGLSYILIGPIREYLQSRGFDVESPGFLKGKSGANHMFDVIASKGGMSRNIVVIDLATSNEGAVSEQSTIALFAKVYDVAPDKAFLIAIPAMSESGRKLADMYQIALIEAKDQNEAMKTFEASVSQLPEE